MTKAKVTFPSAPDTSAIDIKDEGSLIVSNPTAMNFTGPGVTVTENPTGTAEVDIPGLQYWTESEDATTQQSTIFTPNNSATNVNAVIQPKGNGANTAQTPDGTNAGGDARGQYATDWQKNRNNANEVASANNSTISGGRNNRASGTDSTVSGGRNNISSGTDSAVSGGRQNTSSGAQSFTNGYGNTASNISSEANGFNCIASGGYSHAVGYQARTQAFHSYSYGEGNDATSSSTYSFITGYGGKNYLRGQRAHSSRTTFNNGIYSGNCQISDLIASAKPTLDVGQTAVLSLDGTGTTNLIIPDGTNKIWNVTVCYIAVVVGTGTGGLTQGECMIGTDKFLFKKISGSSSIGAVTNIEQTIEITMAGATMTYSAGASQELVITFTAPTLATQGIFNIAAKISLLEVIGA